MMKLSIVVLWLLAIWAGVRAALPFFPTYTNSEDVYAINELYNALGLPPLSGWSAFGGDPCSEAWQGVQCLNNSITAIILVGLNLGGKLGDSLANFTSIILLDLSNNHIGGAVPKNLPSTLRNLSLNGNMLTEELPDSFQSLTRLINLDLSGNKLSGHLPPSMGSLASLTTLNLKNNELSGTLDVLQNLPLKELNVANNQFSGSIPAKLLHIPIFQSDGNPLNVPISPSPNQPAASSSVNGPTQQEYNAPPPLIPLQLLYHEKRVMVGKAIGYTVAIVSSLLILMLLARFILSRLKERKSARIDHHFLNRLKVIEHENTNKPNFANSTISSTQVAQGTEEKAREQNVNSEEVISLPLDTNQINSGEILTSPKRQKFPSSLQAFSVASLQQFTNSFCKGNLIRECSFGKVYRADHQEQKLYAVLKIDIKIALDDFLKMVESISEIKHPNIVELVGYCAEYKQRLLIYCYFSETTLHDILHSHNDSITNVLSWISRIRVALKAAQVLQYLQEGAANKHVIHQHFETRNILVDDELEVRVFGSGLASLLSESELQSYCCHALSYDAPEVTESGLWSDKSDVYNFGVVMLELLTGREPYDSSRIRAERHLARWAASQLYDIDALVKMVDPSLRGRFPIRSLSRIADIISRCIQEVPEFRPSMSEIVQDLSLALNEATRSI